MANSSSSPPHENENLHLVFVPMLAPGHFIPMIDMAKLIAKRSGVTATVFITPVIAARYDQTINQSEPTHIRFVQVTFPSKENGLPEGNETSDKIQSDQWFNYLNALDTWQISVGNEVEKMEPFPNCMVIDRFIPKVAGTAKKLGIRRLIFDGMGCLSLALIHHIEVSGILETVVGSDVPFVLPGLPDKIELTKNQLPVFVNAQSSETNGRLDELKEADRNAYGILINSFEELERDYIEEVQKLHQNRAWCFGPLSLSNKEKSEMARRGNMTSIDENECLKWLDRHASASVIYVCLGSTCIITLAQMSELGRALEESNRPFIWVIRESEMSGETEKWLSEYKYEERTLDRGLMIRGWAPQILILSHKAVGTFLTHCGWNSTMEGISCGVPMITWPLSGEQFFNEKLIVQNLSIGVGVGAKVCINDFTTQKDGNVSITSETILEAIEEVMGGGEAMRKRAIELGEAAKKATQEGGSSYNNIDHFLRDIAMPYQNHAILLTN